MYQEGNSDWCLLTTNRFIFYTALGENLSFTEADLLLISVKSSFSLSFKWKSLLKVQGWSYQVNFVTLVNVVTTRLLKLSSQWSEQHCIHTESLDSVVQTCTCSPDLHTNISLKVLWQWQNWTNQISGTVNVNLALNKQLKMQTKAECVFEISWVSDFYDFPVILNAVSFPQCGSKSEFTTTGCSVVLTEPRSYRNMVICVWSQLAVKNKPLDELMTWLLSKLRNVSPSGPSDAHAWSACAVTLTHTQTRARTHHHTKIYPELTLPASYCCHWSFLPCNWTIWLGAPGPWWPTALPQTSHTQLGSRTMSGLELGSSWVVHYATFVASAAQSIRLPQIVKRSISRRSFLGVLCFDSGSSFSSPSSVDRGGAGCSGSGGGGWPAAAVVEGSVSGKGNRSALGAGWVVMKEAEEGGWLQGAGTTFSTLDSPECVEVLARSALLGLLLEEEAVEGFSNSLSSMLALLT